jgi:hypothetical protein
MRTTSTTSAKIVTAKASRSKILTPREERTALFNQSKIHGIPIAEYGFLNANGLLPLELPDGLRVVFLPDIHAPAHDKPKMWAVKQFLADYQPHILVLIGDTGDVFSFSAWAPNPLTPVDLMREIEETRELIDELLEISGALHCLVTMGNHEDRIRRWIARDGGKLQSLVNADSRESTLSFHEMLGYRPGDHITFINDLQGAGGFGGGMMVNSKLKLVHGRIVRPRPGASPRAMAEIDLKDIIHGHTHSLGTNHREVTRGFITASEIGHLANPVHAYLAYANIINKWHAGFGYGEVINGNMHLSIVPIVQIVRNLRLRDMFVVNGKQYLSDDR